MEKKIVVKYYVPPAGHPLQPYVEAIWRGYIPDPPKLEIILPKGLIDIVFFLSTPGQIIEGKSIRDPLRLYSTFLGGLHTGAIKIKPAEEFYNMGVCLRPEMCASILHLPLNELTDLTIEASYIFKDINLLWEKLCTTTDFEKQCVMIEHWLLPKIDTYEKQKLIQHSCNYLRNEHSEIDLVKLSKSLGVSSRHLRRLFLNYVGVTPSHYLRLSRFIKAVNIIPSNSKSLTQIAHDVYYTDQSHFCRNFKEIAGMTPIEYKKAVNKVPGHIFL